MDQSGVLSWSWGFWPDSPELWFDPEREATKIPNAEITRIGDYPAVVTRTFDHDRDEIVVSWMIGHKTKSMLATFLASEYDSEEALDASILQMVRILETLKIRSSS